MFFKILNDDMFHYKFQYQMGLNVDIPNGDGLFFADEQSILGYLEWGTKIANVEVPKDAPLITHDSHVFSSNKLILTEIRDIWNMDTWKYLVEECCVSLNYDGWLEDIAILEGFPDIAQYISEKRKDW